MLRVVVLATLLSIALAWPPAAHGRDLYVSNVRGSDAFSGELEAPSADGRGPLRTIATALRLAGPGDRIVLENVGVPYRESVSLVGSRNSGTELSPFTIVGRGAILDGSAAVPPEAWQHYRENTYRFRPPKLAYQQLFLDGRPAARVLSNPTVASPVKLAPLEWTLHQSFLYFRTEEMKLPEEYPLTFTALPVGITLFHVRNVVLADLIVQGFQQDGISAFNSAMDVRLEHVTCRGNAQSGIVVGGASRVTIDACLVGDNGNAQLRTLPWSETFLRGTELLENTAPAMVRKGGRVTIDGEAK